MIKIPLIKRQKDLVAKVLIDRIQTDVLIKSEKEVAWDIAENMISNQEDTVHLRKHEIQLICNALIRYKNRYRNEEELGNECFSIYNYIISCCRKEV